jgi:hypothetical protein
VRHVIGGKGIGCRGSGNRKAAKLKEEHEAGFRFRVESLGVRV